MKNRKWIGALVYAALSLVIAILWFAKFDNIAIGIIFTVVSVVMFIIAMLQKKSEKQIDPTMKENKPL